MVIVDVGVLRSEGTDVVSHLRRSQPTTAVFVAGTDIEEITQWSGADGCFPAGVAGEQALPLLEAGAEYRRAKCRGRFGVETRAILVLDWDRIQPAMVCQALTQEGYSVTRAPESLELLRRLRVSEYSVVICPPLSSRGLRDIVRAILLFDPRIRVVVTSDDRNLEDAMRALSIGACDYLMAPVGPQQAVGVVRAALAEFQQTTPDGQPLRGALHVLVVESSATRGRLITQALSVDRHLTVHLVHQIEAAREVTRKRRFDAIVYELTGSSWAKINEFQSLMRAIPAVPLLLTTDVDNPDFLDHIMRCGVEDVVVGPRLGSEALASRVRRAVSRAKSGLQRTRFVRDLRRREASQQEVVSRSLDAMLVVDIENRVVFANPAAEELFERSQWALLGSECPLTVSGDGTSELQVVTARGPTWVDATRVEMNWNGASAFLITVRDVTERRSAQALREQLTHSDRLAAIGQLAAGVAHEINNPAAYVVANLVSMREQLSLLGDYLQHAPPALKEAYAELQAMTEENVDGMRRIQDISRDLRNFSRIESEELSEFDVNECVESACRLTSNVLKHRARVVVQTEEALNIVGSAAKFSQVVINLLVNAAQALPEGRAGHHRVFVTTKRVDNEVSVLVEDTGCGIPVELRSRIFEPFFTTKQLNQGTGLGLAMCADIVRLHGGTIRVGDSTYGGALFEVRLPLAKLREQPDTPSQPEYPHPVQMNSEAVRRRVRVLLIDDEPLILRSFARMLREHEVVTALGGERALALIDSAESFDLILCDLMMPGMNGPQVYEELTRLRPDLVGRVAFCSGGAVTPGVRQFIEQTARPLVEKPFTLESFEATLAAVSVRPHLRLVSGDAE